MFYGRSGPRLTEMSQRDHLPRDSQNEPAFDWAGLKKGRGKRILWSLGLSAFAPFLPLDGSYRPLGLIFVSAPFQAGAGGLALIFSAVFAFEYLAVSAAIWLVLTVVAGLKEDFSS